MKFTSNAALGIIMTALGALAVMTGCGGEETGARSTLAPIQPSSYVVREPVTTTTAPETEDEGVDDSGRSTAEQEYTVVSGDFPLRVANLFDVPLTDLCNYNDWTPPNCSEFPFPGTVIRIPPGAQIPGSAVASGTDSSAGGAANGTVPQTTLAGSGGECVEGTYTIASGDIPLRVASRFDITLDQLEAANANTPGYAGFVVGTVIKIPC
jgi:LysM repeat protein